MSIDFNLKCRTCLNESNTYYKLIDDVEGSCNILEMLECLVPQINIKSTSQFSTLVCQPCVEKLLSGYKFQQMCIDSHNTLQNVSINDDEKAEVKIIDPLTAEPYQNLKEEYEEPVKQLDEETSSCGNCSNDGFSSSIFHTELSLNKADPIEHNKKGVDTEDTNLEKRQPELSLNKADPIEHTKKRVETEDTNLEKRRTYQCRYCPKTFEKKNSLAAHCRVHKKKELTLDSDFSESVENPISIQEEEEFITIIKENIDNEPQIHDESTNDNLNANSNNNKSVYACKTCGKKFDRSCNLSRHNSVHSLTRPHECKICKYRFADEKMFKAHLFQHKNEEVAEKTATQAMTEEDFKCEVCQRSFMTMKHLAKHFKRKHPEASKHKCDYCKRMFILKDSLLKHIQHHHKSDKALQCSFCKKVFGTARRLKQHMLVHKPFLCPHCGKTFNGSSNLRQHMERHAGLQKYQCPDCPKRFNCKSDVIKHASAHSSAKPYDCDVCGSRFTRKYAMQKHKSLHTANRSFKCDQCSMTFKMISLLKRHLFTHTGEKPHKCKYCERAYAASGDLTKHLRTHIGENTYMCDQCPETFKYQVDLRNHQSEHYKMDRKKPQEEN